jgi:hypothetical protein
MEQFSKLSQASREALIGLLALGVVVGGFGLATWLWFSH